MTDLLIIGAGPAGIAAAVTAAEQGASVTVIDDNHAPGGQIWRGEFHGKPWYDRFQKVKLNIISDARVIAVHGNAVVIEQGAAARTIHWNKVILATGARELFLPFPGWTLPGVTGVGGLQALVKSGLVIRNKRVAVAGSGPLLLAAAAYLRAKGADLVMIAEQVPTAALMRFGMELRKHPKKLKQAAALQLQLLGVPYVRDCYVEHATGKGKLETLQFRQGSKTFTEEVDYAAIAYGFTPETELAAAFGCEILAHGVWVDKRQQTSIQNVYCAGESTGIGGVDVALLEGELAGLAACRKPTKHLLPLLAREQHFASLLNQTFSPRPGLKHLCTADTIVCRCEDVTYQVLRQQPDSRTAKLQTRCGMGPCQGRICGPANTFLFGWEQGSVRPPILPARMATLALSMTQETSS